MAGKIFLFRKVHQLTESQTNTRSSTREVAGIHIWRQKGSQKEGILSGETSFGSGDLPKISLAVVCNLVFTWKYSFLAFSSRTVAIMNTASDLKS